MSGLDVAAIARALASAGVQYVLTGSVAAAAFDAPVEPRDFDIAPDLEPENLARLAGLLSRWNAKPVHDPAWPESLSPEECERWVPDPPTPAQLDHLLTTPHGLFDVVPARSGAYADLVRRALPMPFEEARILVAHPADLVATARMHKPKHQVRVPYLNAVRERLERGESIAPRLPSIAR